MKKKQISVATTPTLGDMLSATSVVGDIEIINECNETLLIISYVEDNVCPLTKVLDNQLLERELVYFGTRDGRTIFKVKGMEDAE